MNDFTIHGLWPQIFPEKLPNCTKTEQFNLTLLKSLESDLLSLWPSLSNYSSPESFWKHEFNKHGQCALEDPLIHGQYGYFKFGIDLMKKLRLLDNLKKHNITPHASEQYNKDLGRLEEVRICLNLSHNYTDCPVLVGSDLLNHQPSDNQQRTTALSLERSHFDVPCLYDSLLTSTSHSAPPKELDGFTIHGMWPKTARHKDPKCKSKEQFDITQLQGLLSDLKHLWPFLKNYSYPAAFWKYEFDIHGRCALQDPLIGNQYRYFKFGIDEMKKLKLLDNLKKHGITPHSSRQYDVSLRE
ncbi:unnamed protein product [Schistosoma margrebowiei]|uniref:Uncharacterized protein n=1 Tax=Schistosoma margrebowiei TaxID=48269 RepID=A0A3P8D036_9TREM|nr:unnamed protein product [Schistosoma margrebowiei]